jgi:hypothetical protein
LIPHPRRYGTAINDRLGAAISLLRTRQTEARAAEQVDTGG